MYKVSIDQDEIQDSIRVQCKAVCDLPAAIMELRDKVDPPKPKEREWRENDVVEALESSKAVTGRIALVERVSDGTAFLNFNGQRGRWTAGQISRRDCWRNLTIEAEEAEEK